MRIGFLILAGLMGGTLAGCTSLDFGPLSIPDWRGQPSPQADVGQPVLIPSRQNAGRTFGRGPVQVALLVPLSGEMAQGGTAMVNGAALAMDFIAANPNIADNITLSAIDSGATPATATEAARQAITSGASLILGPMRADQVRAVGQVGNAAGITVIGFSNNPGAASPGVFLLNVLPDTELRRSLGYARLQGKRGFAAIVPSSVTGDLQESAFRKVSAELGINPTSIQAFNGEDEAETAVARLAAEIMAGTVDTLFIPDRATAPMLAGLLERAGVRRGSLQIIGSGDWGGDQAVAAAPFLAGALYPGLDDGGYHMLAAEYSARFGGTPPSFVTLAYTATILANASGLSMATPRYERSRFIVPGGFNGRDGVFRLKPDGRSDFALVMRKVTPQGAVVVDGPKL